LAEEAGSLLVESHTELVEEAEISLELQTKKQVLCCALASQLQIEKLGGRLAEIRTEW
jgi:hypothetical protein